jgi:hypothetical protein
VSDVLVSKQLPSSSQTVSDVLVSTHGPPLVSDVLVSDVLVSGTSPVPAAPSVGQGAGSVFTVHEGVRQ